MSAIDRLLVVERREGETAFPPLGCLIAAVKAAALDRQGRQAMQALERDSQQLRADPSCFVSLKECETEVATMRTRRAAGEAVPVQPRQWSTADTMNYLRNHRQEPYSAGA